MLELLLRKARLDKHAECGSISQRHCRGKQLRAHTALQAHTALPKNMPGRFELLAIVSYS